MGMTKVLADQVSHVDCSSWIAPSPPMALLPWHVHKECYGVSCSSYKDPIR